MSRLAQLRGLAASRNSRALLLLAAGAGAALILLLGTTGTLSSWTQAVINNSSNTAATGKAVVLQETGPTGSGTCTSSSDPSNSATCATINKYGGTTTPLLPGTSQSVSVTFSNTGLANAVSFQLAPGACTQTPAAGGSVANVCTNGDLTVAASCSPGSSYNSAAAWTDLSYSAGAPPTATKTHAASGGDLNAGSSWTCQFSVALSASASLNDQGITVSQSLTWTLSQ